MQMHKHKPLFLIPIIAMILFFIVLYKFNFNVLLTNADKVKEFIQGFGIFGPIILTILITGVAASIVLPSTVLTMTGGYLYGPLIGTICSVIGTLVGSMIIFSLSKKYGRPFVEKHVHKKDLEHFDIIFKKRGISAFVMIRLVPLMPNDVVNLAIGLTKISFKAFFWISLLGYIPETIVYTMFGQQLLSGHLDAKLIILMAIAVLFFFVYISRHKLRVLLIKEIREFEGFVGREEKKIVDGIKVLEDDAKNIENAVIKKVESIENNMEGK